MKLAKVCPEMTSSFQQEHRGATTSIAGHDQARRTKGLEMSDVSGYSLKLRNPEVQDDAA